MVSCLSFGAGCMTAYEKSVGGDTEKAVSKIYLTDFNKTWTSVLESLKSAPLSISNRESGYIRTKWISNTAKKNFIDSFGPGKTFLKAQYRLTLTVQKGIYSDKAATKVSILKEQLIQDDVLDGWRPVVSDLVEENTFHYRIGRLIYMKLRIARLEEAEAREAARSLDDDEDLDQFEELDDDEESEEGSG